MSLTIYGHHIVLVYNTTLYAYNYMHGETYVMHVSTIYSYTFMLIAQ